MYTNHAKFNIKVVLTLDFLDQEDSPITRQWHKSSEDNISQELFTSMKVLFGTHLLFFRLQ